jgi:hypothetical protein
METRRSGDLQAWKYKNREILRYGDMKIRSFGRKGLWRKVGGRRS